MGVGQGGRVGLDDARGTIELIGGGVGAVSLTKKQNVNESLAICSIGILPMAFLSSSSSSCDTLATRACPDRLSVAHKNAVCQRIMPLWITAVSEVCWYILN